MRAPAPGRRPAASARSRRSMPTAMIRGQDHPQVYRALTRRERHEELSNTRSKARSTRSRSAPRDRRRQGRDQHQRAVGNGRRAADPARRARAHARDGLRASPAARACRTSSARSRPPTASAICRSSARAVLSARCGSALIPRLRNGSRRWSMRIPGSPAGITACRMPRIRWPQDPYPRVKALRETMREGGISDDVPIVMAGGVWYLRDWNDWIDNPELGKIAFQFGTRPLLTKESPIPEGWKIEADDAGGRRRPAPPLLADRLLFVGGAQSRSCAASRRGRSARSPFRPSGRRSQSSSSTSA
jgi:nitronate monooxygenase